MIRSVSHQDQRLVFRRIDLRHHSVHCFLIVFCRTKKRRSDLHRFKTIPIRFRRFQHPVVLDPVDHMGRLDDRRFDSVCRHPLQRFLHIIKCQIFLSL